MLITEDALQLYARQILLPEIGESGQQKLLQASVLVVGCGGLGAPVLQYLVAMGIGHIGLMDGDVVSLSNLNRQVLYGQADLGQPKAPTAAARLQAQNPWPRLTVYERYLTAELAAEILPTYDIAVDCLDNFAARFILNDACVDLGKPLVHAGVEGFCGQQLTIVPGQGPCLRCLLPQGANKAPATPPGILGTTPAVLGAMQATEVAKYVLGLPLNQDGFLYYDGLRMSCEKIHLQPSPRCRCRNREQKPEDRR